MKIVVDTNIIFSALLNSNSVIGSVLFNSKNIFEFYSCTYMRFEIDNHWEKLKKISKLSDDNLLISKQLIFEKIKFIDEALIPQKTWLEAENLTSNIDENDISFVALSLFLDANLWTGDKILINGLKNLKFENILNTEELNFIFKSKYNL